MPEVKKRKVWKSKQNNYPGLCRLALCWVTPSLARHISTLLEPSLPACTEPKDQLEMKAHGFLRSILSVCSALGIHMFSRHPSIHEKFPKVLFSSKISLLGFSSCTFGLSVVHPNYYSLPQTAVACSLSLEEHPPCSH